MTNYNHFPKAISLWEFDYGLFTNLQRIIVACDFSPSSFKLGFFSKFIQIGVKTTCHVKLKCFLWTKLLESLLLAKHLISVTAALIKKNKMIISFYKSTFPLLHGHYKTFGLPSATNISQDWPEDLENAISPLSICFRLFANANRFLMFSLICCW